MRINPFALALLAIVPVSMNYLPAFDLTASPGIRAGRVHLFQAFPFEVRSGDEVTLYGSGFSLSSNTVSWGKLKIRAASNDGSSLRITTPDLPDGEYDLVVSNLWGDSTVTGIKTKVKVAKNPAPPPDVSSVYINGDKISVKGTGFTRSNNLITTLGNIENVYSDGAGLTFRLTELPNYSKVKKGLKPGVSYLMPLWIYVQNEHGINKTAFKIDINI